MDRCQQARSELGGNRLELARHLSPAAVEAHLLMLLRILDAPVAGDRGVAGAAVAEVVEEDLGGEEGFLRRLPSGPKASVKMIRRSFSTFSSTPVESMWKPSGPVMTVRNLPPSCGSISTSASS